MKECKKHRYVTRTKLLVTEAGKLIKAELKVCACCNLISEASLDNIKNTWGRNGRS